MSRHAYSKAASSGIHPIERSSSFAAATDEALVEAIRLGSQEAIEQFFERYFGLVFRIARRILRDDGEAQDIAQEVFFNFVYRIALYDERKSPPRVWIRSIAYHRSLDRRNYLNLRRFYDHIGLEVLEMPVRRPSPCYEPPRVVREQDLDAAFSTLKPPQRQAIEMYCLQGFSFREIAEHLDMPLANVRHHYYRGLEKLRANLPEAVSQEVRRFMAQG